ncbi:unnamed protein product [Acanthoscelides obtectus]|uniref:Uncharacterized protein n=1 Tax=Acanthoscelides obtectus TaxID=200917 RepID=A0A9P0KNX7_ACAOB|nr:unnamed protein product [Acanthoscelides obtectus]CAK1667583.1 hypothetical protein AOBTE_LOCUS25929 [Acanthoscelides obtectus]
MKMGSMTLTSLVNLVTRAVATPQITPITVPPRATTQKFRKPDKTSTYRMLFRPISEYDSNRTCPDLFQFVVGVGPRSRSIAYTKTNANNDGGTLVTITENKGSHVQLVPRPAREELLIGIGSNFQTQSTMKEKRPRTLFPNQDHHQTPKRLLQ